MGENVGQRGQLEGPRVRCIALGLHFNTAGRALDYQQGAAAKAAQQRSATGTTALTPDAAFAALTDAALAFVMSRFEDFLCVLRLPLFFLKVLLCGRRPRESA